jgi:hypothetical protein
VQVTKDYYIKKGEEYDKTEKNLSSATTRPNPSLGRSGLWNRVSDFS